MTQQMRNRFPRPSSGSQGAVLACLEDRGKQSCTLTDLQKGEAFVLSPDQFLFGPLPPESLTSLSQTTLSRDSSLSPVHSPSL